MTMLYNRTNGSVLVCMIFHAFLNIAAFTIRMPREANNMLYLYIPIVILATTLLPRPLFILKFQKQSLDWKNESRKREFSIHCTLLACSAPFFQQSSSHGLPRVNQDYGSGFAEPLIFGSALDGICSADCWVPYVSRFTSLAFICF